MLEYCKKNLQNLSEGPNSFGHWHYTYLYYSQVMYRQGNKEWEPFRDKLYSHILKEQQPDGSWTGNIGPIYVTACNLIMLQLDKAYLPIYHLTLGRGGCWPWWAFSPAVRLVSPSRPI